MVPNAERWGKTSAESDARITPLGGFLRKYKLDELPQFMNVLRGDMSVVGPRPEFPEYTALYTPAERSILNVRPGITDLASIEFRNLDRVLEESRDPEGYYVAQVLPEKNRLRLEYVRSQSVLGDLKIILKTLVNLFSDRLDKQSKWS